MEYADLASICLWEKEQRSLEVCYLVHESPCSPRAGVMGSPYLFLHYTSVCTLFLKIYLQDKKKFKTAARSCQLQRQLEQEQCGPGVTNVVFPFPEIGWKNPVFSAR